MHRTQLQALLLLIVTTASLLGSCRSPQFGGSISIQLTADGQTREQRVNSGSTVLEALQQAGITVGDMDRAEPPFYAVLSEGDAVTLTRVKEEFLSELITVPYEHQTV